MSGIHRVYTGSVAARRMTQAKGTANLRDIRIGLTDEQRAWNALVELQRNKERSKPKAK